MLLTVLIDQKWRKSNKLFWLSIKKNTKYIQFNQFFIFCTHIFCTHKGSLKIRVNVKGTSHETKIWKTWETNLSLVMMANTSYIVYLLFWKPVRNTYLGTVKHDWIPIVWKWVSRKHFLSARSNIWNFKVVSFNKSTCLLRHGCFNRNLSVVTLV